MPSLRMGFFASNIAVVAILCGFCVVNAVGTTTSSRRKVQDSGNSTPGTLLDVLMNTSSLSLLAGGIGNTSLGSDFDGVENYTIFAPINDAFTTVNSTLLTLLLSPPYVKHLENLFLFHAVDDAVVLSSDLSPTQNVTMSNNENITVTLESGAVTLFYAGENGTSTPVNVSEADKVASNGVLHTIAGVLLPKFVFTPLVVLAAERSIEGYTTIFELIDVAFPDGLSGFGALGPLTVLAPNDDAFAALGEEALNSLKNDTGRLTGILANHVLTGIHPSPLLKDGQNFSAVGGAKVFVTFEMDDVMFNDAKVVQPDVLAIDAIVHGIDKVMLPATAPTSPVSSPVAAPVADAPAMPPAPDTPVAAPVNAPAMPPVADAPVVAPVVAPVAAPVAAPTSSSSMAAFSLIGFYVGIIVSML